MSCWTKAGKTYIWTGTASTKDQIETLFLEAMELCLIGEGNE